MTKERNMNDVISRQAAIKALAKFVPYAICDESTESYTNGLTDAYNLICQLPSAQPEIIRCKDCGHFHYDTPYVIQGVPVLGHEVCDFWGDGCKTSENGYCSFAERREDERPES